MQGVAYMSLSASCLAGSFLFIKLGLEEIPFFLFVFLRFLCPLLLVIGVLWISGTLKKSFRRKMSMGSHLARAFSVLGIQYSLLIYLTRYSLLDATVLLNTGPLFIPILERCFLQRKIGKSTWISLAVSACGVLLVLQPASGIFNSFVLLGLFAGLMQGVSQVLYSMHSQEEPQATSLLYLFLISTVISFVVYCVGGIGFSLSSPVQLDGKDLALLLLMGLCTIGNQFFRGCAYRHSHKAGNLAPFLYITVILSGIFDWAVFKKIPNQWMVLGAALIIIGGVLKVVLRRFFIQKKSL